MKKVVACSLSLCFLLALTSCGTNATASATENPSESPSTNATATTTSLANYVYEGTDPLIVHLGEINSQFPLNLAYNLGFLDKEFEGSNVQFTMDYFENGPAISEAFASKDLDFAEFGEQAALSGVSAGYGYKIIGRNCDTVENI